MTALALDPADPSFLYAAFGDKTVHITTDRGAHWSPVKGPFAGKDVSSLAVDSHSVVFLGTRTGSYTSKDHGAIWSSSSFGPSMLIDPRSPDVVYSSGFGVTTRTSDGGTTWSSFGVGGATAIAAHPTGGALFAGTLGQGVLRSTDGLVTFAPVNRGLRGSVAGGVALDPGNSSTVYAGSRGHFSVSVDGGAAWKESAIAFDATSIARDPGSPAAFYAVGANGAWKTNDGGATWKSLTPTVPMTTLMVAPDAPSTVYFGSQSGLYKTIDGGSTIVRLAGAGSSVVWSIAADPNSAGTIYATTQNGPVFRSTDAGATFTAMPGLPVDADTVPIVVLPDSTVIAAFNGAVFRSRDKGVSWTPARVPQFAYPGAMAADPRAPGTVYFVVAGGLVFKSVDSGATWSNTAGGLPDLGIFSLAVSGNTLYAATLGGGVFKNFTGGD